MEIEAGRVDILAWMGELHRRVPFVRPLVVGEPRVTVNTEERPAVRSRVGDKIRSDLVEMRAEVLDEPDSWAENEQLVFVAMFLEPRAPVIALQALQEVEQGRCEIGFCGHSFDFT